jgi:formylglycine-generating enzyme required for sulfatase activity
MTADSPARSEIFVTTRPKYPYPGLRPFEAEEWSIFFGRERMIDEVIERLAEHRLVLIHGASGAGKSSLVRAGVLPKLARQHRRARAPWRTCTMRPSGGPLWNLATELARLESNADNADRVGQIVGQLSRRGATLSAVVGSLQNLGDLRLCILVDQFEELFRFEKETSREEAELFVDLLVRGNVEVTDSGQSGEPAPQTTVHVVVTMRSEFLGECARFNGLAETINRTQYLVPRMERDDLLRAICRPAQLYGAEVSLDLAERLIADAAGFEDELPLIQHSLMVMWHESASGLLPGGRIILNSAPLDAAGGVTKLLSTHADAAVDAAAPDPARRYAVERLFRALTDVNVEGKAIRRPQAFRDLVAVTEIEPRQLHSIIDALRRDGVSFLTPYPPQPIVDATPIDISHEALLRCWDRLADAEDGWLKREFDDGLVWRSLLVEARSFERDKRRVLSPATTEERSDWWRERKLNGSWADRYGGNFGLVEKLLAASRHNAHRQRLLQYAFIGLLLCISAAGIAYACWTDRSSLQLWADLYLRRPVLSLAQERGLKPGDPFQECFLCPKMVVVPAGQFGMGPPVRDTDKPPPNQVVISKPFAVSTSEVTFAQWDLCYALGGCGRRPDDYDWGRGDRPVIYVSWEDSRQYIEWLSKITGKPYRLLSEAEYEYATRAGTTTAYPWGDDVKLNGTAMANCNGCGSKWDKAETAPVDSFAANGFGLYDMVGNVWEWTEDCFHGTKGDDALVERQGGPTDDSTWRGDDPFGERRGVPTDGSPWLIKDCRDHVVRGGSWNNLPTTLHSAYRDEYPSYFRDRYLGFRVARTLLAP